MERKPAPIPSTGTWIRDHLLEVREDYPYSMWKKFRDFKAAFGFRAGSYANFRRYIYFLKRLGLIEPVRGEYVKGRLRIYYRVVPGTEPDPRWGIAQIACYPTTGFGGRRGKKYREWVEKGRPERELLELMRRKKLR